MIKRLIIIVIALFINNLLCAQKSDKLGPWNLKELYKVPKWQETLKAKKEDVKGLLYESLPYKGNKVQVFAYYSAPKGEKPKNGWPAIICLHGGGGTAFDTWVKKWNSYGFAAISMDLEGHYPIKDTLSLKKGQRISTENPGCIRKGTFEDFNLPIKEQWYYNAVAHVIIAHSLIRSFPEINARKIGITGISWGGVLTSTIMGIDDRFKFAIPVYGSGYLPNSDGAQGNNIKQGKHTDVVNTNYDGSAYFKNVIIPSFWLNGTNDKHFSISSTQKSLQSVKGATIVRYEKKMPHGHQDGWKPEEIYTFANSIVNNTEPLTHISRPIIRRKTIEALIKNKKSISKVQLYYTLDLGTWNQRKWQATKATLKRRKIKANIPKEAKVVYLSVIDKKGLMVTSEFVEIIKER